MGFESVYTAIFDDIHDTIKALSIIKQVIYKREGRGVIRKLPCVFINPGMATLALTDSPMIASTDNYALEIRGRLVVLIREGDSETWFEDILEPIGEIVDAIMADSTLGGTCLHAWVSAVAPGETTFQNKLYYGGAIDIRVIKEYS